jgi:transcriptional regulator with XRE-family HTH domain
LFLAKRHYECHDATMKASENGTELAISPAQLRAGRALVGWSQDELVTASGVPKRTVVRFELGQGEPQRRTLAAIRAALEAAGVAFIPENGGGAGVRLSKR